MNKSGLFWWRAALATARLAVLAGCRTAGGPGGTAAPAAGAGNELQDMMLTADERAELLRLARHTLEVYLSEKHTPHAETDNPKFLLPCGAFVTLKKHGDLRGCIGYMVAEEPAYETIRKMAVAAATKDPRFPPVQASELAEIEIEISLLSPLERVTDTSRIEVGKHGLLIHRGYRQGVLLPQVAPEQGWDRDEFLEGVCLKAGLPPNAWSDPGTELYWFTATVFGEGE